jgi:putative nucleotidyltransferase with HDIG domain
VFLLDETGEALHCHSSYHGVGEKEKRTVVPVGKGIAGVVAAEGKSWRIPDVTQVEECINLTPETRSELAVPVRAGERVLGVINAESFHKNAFTEGDERLLGTLANQLATAIEKIRLIETARHRTQELIALYDAAVSIGHALDADQMMERLYTQVKKLFAPDSFLVVTCDEQTENLEVAMAVEEDKPLEGWEDKRFPVEEGGLTGWVVREGFPLLIRDMETDTLPAKPKHSTNPARSWLGVPLLTQNKVVGAISVQSFPPRTFNERDRHLLENMASHLAVTMENSRLYEETRQAYVREKRVNELTRAVNSTLDFRKILENVVRLAVELVGADGGALALLSEDKGTISYPYLYHLPEKLGQQESAKGEGLAWRIVESGESVMLTEYGKASNALSHWVEEGVHGFIGVPVIAKKGAIGALGLFNMGPVSQTDNGGNAKRRLKEFTKRELTLAESIGLQVGGIINNAHLFSETKRRTEYLETIQNIDRAISSSLDLDLTLNIFLEQVMAQLGADAADILLMDVSMQMLECAAHRGFTTEGMGHRHIKVGEGYAGKAVLEREIIHVNSSSEEERSTIMSPHLLTENLDDYYAVPLIAKGKVKGVLELFIYGPFNPDPAWTNYLNMLATQAAIAIDSIELYEDLQKSNMELTLSYDNTLKGWAKALELRDEETEGHSQRVTELTLALARKMGINQEKMPQIRRGALLHDIGKMGIPDSLLLKEGSLTEEEWEEMKKHPVLAYDLLSPIPILKESLDIPYCHHEKWDGTGYPRGLEGEGIPLAARIFAVADVWDALRSDRPYRKAWSDEKALEHIKEESGKHFDPRAVESFLGIVNVDDAS